MKQILLSTVIISLIALGISTFAVTIGEKPPVEYINNLKNCKAGTIKVSNSVYTEYTIKGKLPDGRCEVEILSYTNFADPEVYKGFIGMMKVFGGDKVKPETLPTQAQMIEQGKKEKNIDNCKFTPEQRLALYNAYQKNDGTNGCTTDKNGSQKCTFSTDNMSSYDKLMLNYTNGTCIQK